MSHHRNWSPVLINVKCILHSLSYLCLELNWNLQDRRDHSFYIFVPTYTSAGFSPGMEHHGAKSSYLYRCAPMTSRSREQHSCHEAAVLVSLRRVLLGGLTIAIRSFSYLALESCRTILAPVRTIEWSKKMFLFWFPGTNEGEYSYISSLSTKSGENFSWKNPFL